MQRRQVLGGVLGLSFGPRLNLKAVAAATAEPLLSPEDILADLDAILPTVESIHPNLDFTADLSELRAAVAGLRARIDRPMTVRAAWAVLARLNPLFRDAHVGLRHPVDEFDAYRAAGGAVFPTPVFVDREGRLRVSETVSRSGPLAPLDEIESINGIAASRIVSDLMPLMRGETESLRRFVLAFNFGAHFWTLYGPQESYRVSLRGADGVRRTAALTGDLAPPPVPAARAAAAYAFRVLSPGVGLLRVATFDPALRAEFARFLDETFEAVEAMRLTTLIIDVRDNPGGAHDLSDLLAARLTVTPIPTASKLTARITADNRDLAPGAAVGEVVSIPFDEMIVPDATRPPFGGDVHLLVNQDTYSQAIVFAATLQDHGLASVVGEVTGGNANITGQITLTPLSNTRLQVLAPLYIIYRPNGDERPGGLQPDTLVPDDRSRPELMIETLTGSLDRGRGG